MSKYALENYIGRLEHLKKDGFPDSDETPMTIEEIGNMQIGTPCYVVSSAGLNLRMYYGKNNNGDLVWFVGETGNYSYKLKNAGKTFNVFKPRMEVI